MTVNAIAVTRMTPSDRRVLVAALAAAALSQALRATAKADARTDARTTSPSDVTHHGAGA